METVLGTCTWLVKRPTFAEEIDFPEDAYRIEDCGMPIIKDDEVEGWECEFGHGHVPMQTRYEQGWDYDDEDSY